MQDSMAAQERVMNLWSPAPQLSLQNLPAPIPQLPIRNLPAPRPQPLPQNFPVPCPQPLSPGFATPVAQNPNVAAATSAPIAGQNNVCQGGGQGIGAIFNSGLEFPEAMCASVQNHRDKHNFDYVDHFDANNKITRDLMNELRSFIPHLDVRRETAMNAKRDSQVSKYRELLAARKLATDVARYPVHLDQAIDELERKLFQ